MSFNPDTTLALHRPAAGGNALIEGWPQDLFVMLAKFLGLITAHVDAAAPTSPVIGTRWYAIDPTGAAPGVVKVWDGVQWNVVPRGAGMRAVDCIDGFWSSPAAGAFTLVLKAPYAMEITGIHAKLAGGSLTAALSVSGVAQDTTALTTNALSKVTSIIVPEGAQIAVTFSAVTSATGLAYQINFVRA